MCDENSLYDINLESPPQESCKQTQKLTCYASEDDDSDTSPWLPSRSPPLGFRGISQYHSPHGRQDSSCLLLKDLGLSPSLFTCPGQHLSLPQFQDGTECLSSAVLFEDVYLSSQDIDSTSSRYLEDPDQMVPDIFSASSDLLQSAFSLDHCYLSTKCTTTEDCCSISGVKTSVSACSKYPLKEEVDNEKDHVVSSVDDESSGSTWTPSSREKLPTPSSSKKVRRPKHIFQHLKRLQKQHCPFHLKKKCVNGFIMFCRLNRKQYICDHPGTASTAATQALANLWRVMSKQERRPYRIKARQFNKLHNRIVKLEGSSSEDEEANTLKPLSLLLAEKSLFFL
ncbi:meiosis initiator protein [Protopterus annectens]|uniref:meiosis initiator protein n=1 Tax=Protopterus annectens TaxID=7888 RepID=UPI001CFBCDF6|nr:meiosis initiator protein [Protopterus annectens]